MVVEDSARARQGLSAYLAVQPGIKVVAEAANGLEAITLIHEQVPDFILMDVLMPVMNGLEATKIIKMNWPQVKIIILTMYDAYQPELLAAGADGFFVKGCPQDEMISRIRALFQPERTDDENPQQSF